MEIPLFRTFAGLVLILIGIRFVLHAWMPALAMREAPPVGPSAEASRPSEIDPNGLKYDIVFSEGTIDLTRLEPLKKDLDVEVNVIFGAAKVRLDPAVPFDLHASSAFGEVRMPDRRGVSFGELRSSSGNAQGPRIHLRVSAVFAFAQVEERAGRLAAGPGPSTEAAVPR